MGMNTPDQRLRAIRDKEAVISTYRSDTLLASPEAVNNAYRIHAATHMAIGDTSTFKETLLKWTTRNKGCVIGAVVGPYGYGKTSTEIHLWHECDRHRIVAVPPFTWTRLSDLIDATFGWVDYHLAKVAPDTRTPLQAAYNRYTNQSLTTLAAEHDLSEDALRGLHERGLLKLKCSAADVIDFFATVHDLLEPLGYHGPIVFTDELQVTLAEYEQRDEFMDDLFGLLTALQQRQGSYGMVIGMPTATEALIQDVRADIIQRLQAFKFFLRPERLYDKQQFASELWQKFAQVYEFTDIMGNILPQATLKSIGQIAARRDLGAGPRTVIDAFRRAVEFYDKSGTTYTPIDLVNDYLEGLVQFDPGGKLGAAVREAIAVAPIVGSAENEEAIKLLAAFPEGCQSDIQHLYNLAEEIAALPSAYSAQYLYAYVEGPSLRKLAPTKIEADPGFLRLTKEFVGRYQLDSHHAAQAVKAFREILVRKRVFPDRRGSSLVDWKWETPTSLVGATTNRYPDRKLYLHIGVGDDGLDTDRPLDDFGMWVQFDVAADPNDPGEIRQLGPKRAQVRLNGVRPALGVSNIPYLPDLGIAPQRLTPIFLLSLLQHLDDNQQAIPESERRQALTIFTDRLLGLAVELLFNDDLRVNSEWTLRKIGTDLLQDLFTRMCESAYPRYETMITQRGWDTSLETYLLALQSGRLEMPVIRGQQPLKGTRDEIALKFGQKGSQAFQNFQRAVQRLLESKVWLADRAEVLLRRHPLEDLIKDALDASGQKASYHGAQVNSLTVQEVLSLGRKFGYLPAEITVAIDLLSARRYLAKDPNTRRLVQLIESPDERKALVVEKLETARQQFRLLRESTDFNTDKYSASVVALQRRADQASNIATLEALDNEARMLMSDLEAKLNSDISRMRLEIQRYCEQAQGVEEQLTPRPIDDASRSGPSGRWMEFVENIRQEVIVRGDSARQTANTIIAKGLEVLGALDGAENASKQYLIAYRGRIEMLKLRSHFDESRKSAQTSLDAYQEWERVPVLAAQAAREADACASAYGNHEYQIRLERLGEELAQAGSGQALPLYSSTIGRLQAIVRESREWLTRQENSFKHAKALCHEALASLGDRSPHLLRTTFDPYRATESFNMLYAEVREHLERVAQQVGLQLNRAIGDIAYLSLLRNGDTARASLPNAAPAERAFRAVWQDLVDAPEQQLGADDALAHWVDRFQSVQKQVVDLREQIGEWLRKQPPTQEETQVLETLQDGRSMDLGEIVRELGQRQGAEDFSLAELMEQVQGLFLKNQVVIRLERRP